MTKSSFGGCGTGRSAGLARQGSVASVCGAAGSMIVILLWVHYSSIIFLYGAEVTQLSAKALGWQFEPIEAAEELDKERVWEKVPAARAGR